MYIFFILFLTAIFLFIIFFILLIIDDLFGHFLPTSSKAISEILKIIREEKPDAKNFYDLGCARGKLALSIKKERPNLELYAFDKSALRLFFAKLKNLFLRRKINFLKKDIFKVDLSDADVVYCYLWWDLLPPLKEKLQKELKKGSIVITNTSYFPGWEPYKTMILNPKKPGFEKMFIYKVM